MSKPEFFETIKIENGEICNAEWHQKRFERTLMHFGGTITQDIVSLIKPPSPKGLFRCKVVYTPQEIVHISYFPYTKRSVTSLKLLEANKIDYRFKYLDRSAIDALFAQREACDDVLVIQNGLLTDTTIANVAFFDGKEWLTPEKPLLEGTTRARYLAEGRLKPADITSAMLGSFSKIALLNAMIDFDIMPIKEIQKDRIIC